MSQRPPRVRLLPLTLSVAALVLSVKIGAVWRALQVAAAGPLAVATAFADSPKATDAPADGNKPPQANEAPVAAGHGGDAAGRRPARAEKGTICAAPEDHKPEPPAPLFSPAEIEVLQQLGKRRDTLNARATDIDRRETMLKAAEARIDQKAKELEEMRTSLERLVKAYDDQHEAKIRSLVKIYENMKPREAARIFEELDMDTLLAVAERMKERKLAPIMAEMNPGKAKQVTQELAKLKETISSAGAGTAG